MVFLLIILVTFIHFLFPNVFTQMLWNLLVMIFLGLIVVYGFIYWESKKTKIETIFYNPITKKVEFHLGITSELELLRKCKDANKLAKDKKTNIIFNTCHYSESRLKKVYGDRIVISKTNGIQKLSFYSVFTFIWLYYKFYKKKTINTYSLIHCELKHK